jgi:hypothetical protein
MHKRAAIVVILFALLGAAINFPVALLCDKSRTQSPRVKAGLSVSGAEAAAYRWPARTPHPQQWPEVSSYMEQRAFGYRHIQLTSATIDPATGTNTSTHSMQVDFSRLAPPLHQSRANVVALDRSAVDDNPGAGSEAADQMVRRSRESSDCGRRRLDAPHPAIRTVRHCAAETPQTTERVPQLRLSRRDGSRLHRVRHRARDFAALASSRGLIGIPLRGMLSRERWRNRICEPSVVQPSSSCR